MKIWLNLKLKWSIFKLNWALFYKLSRKNKYTTQQKAAIIDRWYKLALNRKKKELNRLIYKINLHILDKDTIIPYV